MFNPFPKTTSIEVSDRAASAIYWTQNALFRLMEAQTEMEAAEQWQIALEMLSRANRWVLREMPRRNLSAANALRKSLTIRYLLQARNSSAHAFAFSIDLRKSAAITDEFGRPAWARVVGETIHYVDMVGRPIEGRWQNRVHVRAGPVISRGVTYLPPNDNGVWLGHEGVDLLTSALAEARSL